MIAYVLMSFDPGAEGPAYELISEMENVKQVNIIYGEWDIVVLVENDSLGALEQFTFEKLRNLDGVRLTSTMIVAK